MIAINGRKFARSDSEFVSSLFDPSGTCSGYYKRLKHGIKLFDHQKTFFALAVNNKHGERFFVSVGIHKEKPFYMYSLTDKDRAFLGFDVLPYRAEREAAETLFAST